jgi:hypothetical protein
MRHDLMTTDEHFEAAIRNDEKAALGPSRVARPNAGA